MALIQLKVAGAVKSASRREIEFLSLINGIQTDGFGATNINGQHGVLHTSTGKIGRAQ